MHNLLINCLKYENKIIKERISYKILDFSRSKRNP